MVWSVVGALRWWLRSSLRRLSSSAICPIVTLSRFCSFSSILFLFLTALVSSRALFFSLMTLALLSDSWFTWNSGLPEWDGREPSEREGAVLLEGCVP